MGANTKETQNTGTTVIGRDAKFKGEIEFESDAKILGRFEGHIRSSGHVEIVDGSSVEATIDAAHIEVDGAITGDVIARDMLKLQPNAIVNGDITAGTLVVSEGASFLGHCRVGPSAIANLEAAPAIGSTAPAPKASAPSATPKSSGVISVPESKPVGRAPVVINANELEPEAVGIGEAPSNGEQIDPEFSPPWKNSGEAKRTA